MTCTAEAHWERRALVHKKLTGLGGDPNLHAACYHAGDMLADSSGGIIEPHRLGTKPFQPTAGDPLLPLDSILDRIKLLKLLKLHQSQLGACCAAKLYLPTSSEAALSLKDHS